MASLNKVMLIGNVGQDPDLRYTPNGTPKCSFSVATNRQYTTTSGERKADTEWFAVVCWNKLAETCHQYVTKGKRVYVEGSVQTYSWDDDTGRHAKTEIVAQRVIFLDSKGAPQPAGVRQQGRFEDDEELPF